MSYCPKCGLTDGHEYYCPTLEVRKCLHCKGRMLPRDNENPFNFARRRFCCMSCAGKWSMAQRAINHAPVKRAAPVKVVDSLPLESPPRMCKCELGVAVNEGRCELCDRLHRKAFGVDRYGGSGQPTWPQYDGNDNVSMSL